MPNIKEIFYSIQGEGRDIGRPSVFVRFSGCNLNCTFCDSSFASKISNRDNVTTKSLYNTIMSFYNTHNKYRINIIFTGGEPMLQQKYISEIIDMLYDDERVIKFNIQIETNGTTPIKFDNLKLCDFNISPKLSNSGNDLKKSINKETISSFKNSIYSIFKFVVKDISDIKEINNFVTSNKIKKEKIYLMPEGYNQKDLKDKTLWLIEICKRHGYNFTPRIHIDIYGNKRGV